MPAPPVLQQDIDIIYPMARVRFQKMHEEKGIFFFERQVAYRFS